MIHRIHRIEEIKDDGIYFIMSKKYKWAEYIIIVKDEMIASSIRFSMIQSMRQHQKTLSATPVPKHIIYILMDGGYEHTFTCDKKDVNEIMQALVIYDSDYEGNGDVPN